MNKFFKAALRKEASIPGAVKRAGKAARRSSSALADSARKSTNLAKKLSNKPVTARTAGTARKVWDGTKGFVKKHPVWTGVGAMAVPHVVSGMGNMFGGSSNYNYRGMDPMQMMMMMNMMRGGGTGVAGGSSMFGGLPFSMPNLSYLPYAYQVPEAFRHTYF